MKTIFELAKENEPDLSPEPLRFSVHKTRGVAYELLVCRMAEFGQYRIYVAKAGRLCCWSFDPKHSVEFEPQSSEGVAIVEDLLATEIGDIDENRDGVY